MMRVKRVKKREEWSTWEWQKGHTWKDGREPTAACSLPEPQMKPKVPEAQSFSSLSKHLKAADNVPPTPCSAHTA